MTKHDETQAASKAADKQAFVNRKLNVLNQKNGSLYERVAARVVENNKQEELL